MKAHEQRAAAEKFAKDWQDKGIEKSDSQQFWTALLRDVFGVEKPETFVEFERPVQLGHKSYIDAYIPETKVLIEQKKREIDLLKAAKQSDGTTLTPYEQGKRYADNMTYDERPRWIITSNFRSFNIHDMNRPHDAPTTVLLENLGKEYHRLQLLVDKNHSGPDGEEEISIKAGELVGKLYDKLIAQYKEPESPATLRSLNILCVRLVFCLYAEDAGIFGARDMFYDYMKQFDALSFRSELIELFKVLNQPEEARDPYLRADLAAFPYVNGGLFADENIEIPNFTDEIRKLVLSKASKDFDWSRISPTIFGAVFESTLNPETRKSGGMHYTSIENIHKVVDPLFLDELKRELNAIQNIPTYPAQKKAAEKFQQKLATLRFLDPACGSGNFLTETYLSIRRLENDVIYIINREQGVFGAVENPIKVTINQFYGIEINDFAVSVARTALWIAESQMKEETNRLAHTNADFLPLKTNAHIIEGNALTLDWNDVCPKQELSYIMGNPPFVGYSNQTEAQKLETRTIFSDENGKEYRNAGKIDYVANWYFKACQYMQGTNICAAFVSTNSITQGDQVAAIWKPLFQRFDVELIFAHRTFRWDSEANLKARVHCVIIGFTVSTDRDNTVKKLYDFDGVKNVQNINPYLIDAPNILIESRIKQICDVPDIITGNRPADGGHLILEDSELKDFVANDPKSERFIKRFLGAAEFIQNKRRWCLWLVNATPSDLKSMPEVLKRVVACRQDRLNAPDEGRRKLAATPHLFRETNNPDTFIIVPRHSSEQRAYIPMGFHTKEVIPGDSLLIIPNATLYHFGVLTSSVHMAWMRAVCGRLEMRYRYSKDVVYNNFIWPNPTDDQQGVIEETAQGILDARSLYPDSSLADLYDETFMPIELRKAHEANDKAVLKAYGFDAKATEQEIVAELMKLYSERTTAGSGAIESSQKVKKNRNNSPDKRERTTTQNINDDSEPSSASSAENERAIMAEDDEAGLIEARDHFREGYKKNPDRPAPGLVEVLMLLAELHMKRGQFCESEEEYVEALSICQRFASPVLYEYYLQIAAIYASLGDIYVKTGHFDAAEEDYKNSIKTYRPHMALFPYMYGSRYSRVLCSFAKMLHTVGRFEEAERNYNEALSIYPELIKRFQDDTKIEHEFAQTLCCRASLLYSLKRYDEAESDFNQSISILQRLSISAPDEIEPSLATSLEGLGRLYSMQGQNNLAEQKLSETVAVYRRLLSRDRQDFDYDYLLAQALLCLSFQRTQLERKEEALDGYLEAVNLLRQNAEQYAPYLADALLKLTEFYVSEDRYEEAEVCCAESVEIYSKLNQANPNVFLIVLATAQYHLSGIRYMLGRNEAAMSVGKEALENLRTLEKRHPGKFGNQVKVAESLMNSILEKLR